MNLRFSKTRLRSQKQHHHLMQQDAYCVSASSLLPELFQRAHGCSTSSPSFHSIWLLLWSYMQTFFSQSPMVLVYFVVYTREDGSDLGVSQQKVFISPLATTLGILDPSVALSLSQGQLLGTKPCSGLTYFS